jgi:hypothetical protein
MSESGGDGAGIQYVPADVLARLVDDMTVEDVRLAQQDYPEGSPMRGFGAVYYAAVRTGATDGVEDASSFLGRVRLRDLTPIMAAASDALPNELPGGGTSPPSAGSGE